MANLKLSLACWDYDRTRPLMDGRVKPQGIDLDIKVLRPRQSFQRMLDNQEFQLSELSLASYTILKARGDTPRRRANCSLNPAAVPKPTSRAISSTGASLSSSSSSAASSR